MYIYNYSLQDTSQSQKIEQSQLVYFHHFLNRQLLYRATIMHITLHGCVSLHTIFYFKCQIIKFKFQRRDPHHWNFKCNVHIHYIKKGKIEPSIRLFTRLNDQTAPQVVQRVESVKINYALNILEEWVYLQSKIQTRIKYLIMIYV